MGGRLLARWREVRANLLSLTVAAIIASQLPAHLAGGRPDDPGVILMSSNPVPAPVAASAPLVKPPRDLLMRCRNVATVAALADDVEGRCALIAASDGESFLLGTHDFRLCRDAIMTEWLPAIPTDRREAVDQFQLEASLACRHLLTGRPGR